MSKQDLHYFSDKTLSLAIVLISFIVCLPFLYYVQWFSDEGILPHGAQRMLNGEILYRDVFAILPPLGYVIIKNWIVVLGGDFFTIRLLAILCVSIIALVTFHLSQLINKAPIFTFTLCTLWLLSSQGKYTVLSHHWISATFVLTAFFFILSIVSSDHTFSKIYRNAFIAGILMGSACMTTSLRGGIAFLGGFSILTTSGSLIRKTLIYYIGGALTLFAIIGIWLIASGSLGGFIEQVIFFAGTRYSKYQWLPFASGLTIQSFPLASLYFITLIIFIGTLLLTKGKCLKQPEVRAAIIMAAIAWISLYPRPSAFNIVLTAPLVIPLFILSVTLFLNRSARKVNNFLLIVFILLFYPVLSDYFDQASQATLGENIQTARGRIALNANSLHGQNAKEVIEFLDLTPKSDKFLFYPFCPLLPYLAKRTHIGPIDVFVPYFTQSSQYQDTLDRYLGLTNWIVLDKLWLSAENLYLFYPLLPNHTTLEETSLEKAIYSDSFKEVVNNHFFIIMKKR